MFIEVMWGTAPAADCDLHHKADAECAALDLTQGALSLEGALVMLLGVPNRGVFLEESEQFLEGGGDEVKVLFRRWPGFWGSRPGCFVGRLRMQVDPPFCWDAYGRRGGRYVYILVRGRRTYRPDGRDAVKGV
jgi:hypothetical protein